MRKFFSTSRLVNLHTPSVWVLFNELALNNSALNLVSGFPNWDPPSFLAPNPNMTSQNFLKILGQHYSPLYKKELDGEKNFCVTPGANYAINNILFSYLQQGDEVVSIEPFYSEYYPETCIAGGKFKGVSLLPPIPRVRKVNQNLAFDRAKDEWKIDWEALKKSINTKTRILMINNPNNPTGKVFTKEELEGIADIIKPFPRIIVISDEVYEKCFFEEVTEIERFANVKNMFDRTINILSAGKIFAATGIRVGWALGPAHLIEPLQKLSSSFIGRIHQPILSSVANAFIEANSSNYYEKSREFYKKGRDELLTKINSCGLNFKFWVPQSGYFVLCDFENVEFDQRFEHFNSEKKDLSKLDKYSKDYAFALWLGMTKKTVGVPVSVFYSKENKEKANNYIRFACCKTPDYFKPLELNLK